MVGMYGLLVSIFSSVDCSFFHSVRLFLQFHFLHTEGGERLGLPGPHQPWSFRSVHYVHSGWRRSSRSDAKVTWSCALFFFHLFTQFCSGLCSFPWHGVLSDLPTMTHTS